MKCKSIIYIKDANYPRYVTTLVNGNETIRHTQYDEPSYEIGKSYDVTASEADSQDLIDNLSHIIDILQSHVLDDYQIDELTAVVNKIAILIKEKKI